MPVSDYYEQVIYVESLPHRGRWIDPHDSKKCWFSEYPESAMVDTIWTKWIVRKAGDDCIVLESVRFPNHFLDARHDYKCYVNSTSYPYNQEQYLWHLEENSDKSFSLRPSRYPEKRIDASRSEEVQLRDGSGDWSKLRVYQPEPKDEKMLLFTYDNSKGTTPVETKYIEKIGISRTDSKEESTTMAVEISAEIESIFSAKTSMSHTWKNSSSSTWSREVTREVTVSVAAGTIKKIYQLRGYYGPYMIASNHLYFDDTEG